MCEENKSQKLLLQGLENTNEGGNKHDEQIDIYGIGRVKGWISDEDDKSKAHEKPNEKPISSKNIEG